MPHPVPNLTNESDIWNRTRGVNKYSARSSQPCIRSAIHDRPAEDRRYHRAFARRRIKVEHGIGRLRRYQALSQVDRHRRRQHTARVRAVAGLVNLMLDHNQDS